VLDAATKAKRSDPPGLKITRLAARSIYSFRFAASSAASAVGKCITNAAIAFVKHVDDPRAFLVVLDAAIVRGELNARLRDRRVTPSSPIARVISRPGTGKSFGLALAELENGSFGLFVKLKNAWTWHEGDRATVFATVPDAYMELVAADLG
jgi:hypothetical protein